MDTIIENFTRLAMESPYPEPIHIQVLDPKSPESSEAVDANFAQILYYQLEFSSETYSRISQLVTEKLNLSEKNAKGVVSGTFNTVDVSYQVNDAFHITVLYTGGKKDERAEKLQYFIGKQFNVRIERIAMNQHYICIGVSIDGELPYYGNEVKHITFGLNKFDSKKKVLPKDSFLALTSEHSKMVVFAVDVDEPIIVQAEFSVKTK